MCKRMLSNRIRGRVKTEERKMNLPELVNMLGELKGSDVMMNVEYWVLGGKPVNFTDYSPEVLNELFINAITKPSLKYGTSIRHETYTGIEDEKHYIELVRSREAGRRIVISSRAKIEYTLPRILKNTEMGLEGLSSWRPALSSAI